MRVLVVGGGIAGVSVAAALAPHAAVTLVETEGSLAYHTTGRSAALYFENYGTPATRPLSRASLGYLRDPPPVLVDAPLLAPRGALTVAAADGLDRLEATYVEGTALGTTVERLTAEEAVSLCPALRPGSVAAALWEPEAADIDVAGLHQSIVRAGRGGGVEILTGTELAGAQRDGSGWTARMGDTVWRGDVIVNAAGAWGDVVAGRCGVEPVGLIPMRRTAFMVPGEPAWAAWPMVVEVGHRWYFKPDGTQLLCSPAEENACEPCDPRPAEIDVALAIDRINQATTLAIRTVRSSWTGLRTFAADRTMVIGPDADCPDFVWLVGQGGTGIQTAPAAGRLAAALALDRPIPGDLVDAGIDVAALSPSRFAGNRRDATA
ncbi:MAG: FAD-binding oxidoreductase [Acidimicrobiia bacterium]|nr:FAD-binding oxidoreductase [Acidimicrobiia bacterium]